ncbi:class I SAM-dependent methyltransferase [Rhodovulum sp. 12E13]|uniref:class I SAM-dependent methyltransferase n=1 Tax=Rhodovulum sp. 12E13 TaxID=2203891 RepID=UPI00131480AB|nr:class I SAM-dependent methyltransferase [Rhodovulum sp. 12E13]
MDHSAPSKVALIVDALRQDPLRSLVRMRRSEGVHDALLQRFQQNLPQASLDGAVLLSDRDQLLRRMPKGGVVCEIGVAEGAFSRQILEVCAPDRLHLVDPWDDTTNPAYSESSHARLEKTLGDEIALGRVQMHRGYSTEVLPTLEADSVDWVYIDGAHDYVSVARDLELCTRVVKPGGIIAGHDYVRWVSPTARYGVVEAVNEFVHATGATFLYLTNQYDKHDSFALRLPVPGD